MREPVMNAKFISSFNSFEIAQIQHTEGAPGKQEKIGPRSHPSTTCNPLAQLANGGCRD
jgi:hypothetical protein